MSAAKSMIGARMPRPEAQRLVAGNGRYTDDIVLAHMGHAVFLRSPHAHARILAIDTVKAAGMPGVIAVVTGEELAAVCRPWQTKLAPFPGHVSPIQSPLARGEVCWQGEPVVAVVAESRAQAEDAIEHIAIEWEELPAIASMEDAAQVGAAPVSTQLATNLGLDHSVVAGDTDAVFRDAAAVVEHDFEFGRQTGVTLEPRGIVADFDPRLQRLTVYHSHQVPSQMREIFAQQLGLPYSNVQVITPDVGGAFGMKLSTYPDEMAVAALSTLLKRPVKFIADRLEAFVSDVHAREATVKGRLAVDAQGKLLAMEVAVRSGFGAYSTYPRGCIGEGLQSVHMSAAPYRLANFKGSLRGYFQNKVPSGVLRAVGQPIACTVTEQLLDFAARKIGMDPAEICARNYALPGQTNARSAAGTVLSDLSLDKCHDKLLALMNYDALRREQTAMRNKGVYRGIGLAAFIEQTGVGPSLYGSLGVRVSAFEACRLSLEPTGHIRCATSVTDQGQGTLTGLRQIVGEAIGVDTGNVEIVSGDTATSPFGGGAWASRGISLGGEAAFRAAGKLRANILAIAGSILQAQSGLRIEGGNIVNAAGMIAAFARGACGDGVVSRAHYSARYAALARRC